MVTNSVDEAPEAARVASGCTVPSSTLGAPIAMALVAATGLLLELALTRLLSVVLWYHWAFFAVTTALFGLALPGVLFSLVRPRAEWLLGSLAGAGVAIPIGVVVVVQWARPAGEAAILICFAALSPSFLLLGAATCLLLLAAPGERVARVYGADLVGASVGALSVIPLLSLLATPRAAAALGLLPLVAALLVAARPLRWERVRVLLPGALVVGLVLGWGTPLQIRHTKTYREGSPELSPLREIWTPMVRLTVFDHVLFAEPGVPFAWGPGEKSGGEGAPDLLWVEQDGSAGTPITRLVGDPREHTYLFDDVTTVGHAVRRARTVAIIGAGGGRDVLTALAAGAERVLAVELHPQLLALVRGPYGDFSGHLYDRPEVIAVAGEGRAVLAASPERFDRIELSLIDSWAATAAGAYTLAENHLYTLEAFRLYWSRLSPEGMLSASRWMRGGFGLELPRLVLLARAMLLAEGVVEPAAHVIVVQGAAVGTLLVGRAPFTAAELEGLAAEAARRGFVVHFPPAVAAPGVGRVEHVFAAGPGAYARHGLRMEPPTDDRPFFFQTVSPFASLSREAARELGVNGEGVWALQRLLTVVGLGALALLALPFFFATRFERRGMARGTAFFAAIGLAFFAVELAWLGRAVLVLGHPSLAAAVVLGAMLLGSGLGAVAAPRLGLRRARWGGLVVALAVALVTGWLAWLGDSAAAWSGPWRLLAVAGAVAPVGAGMGAFLPLGFVRFGDGNKAWFWAVNGAASVVAAAGAVALTMEFGASRIALLGALLYVAATLLLRGPHTGSPWREERRLPDGEV